MAEGVLRRRRRGLAEGQSGIGRLQGAQRLYVAAGAEYHPTGVIWNVDCACIGARIIGAAEESKKVLHWSVGTRVHEVEEDGLRQNDLR